MNIVFLFDVNDYLEFGKYKLGGFNFKKIKEIINEDPEYLQWIKENVKKCIFTNEVKEKLRLSFLLYKENRREE